MGDETPIDPVNSSNNVPPPEKDNNKPDTDMSVVLIEQNEPELKSVLTISPTSDCETPDPNRFCWICLMNSDEDDDKAITEWLHPCHCSGTSKWVHQTCLQMWIDEKQKYNANLKVTCSQCDHEYVLIYPSDCKFVWFVFPV